MEDKDGVWRTIRGRRIFIGKGEDLSTAMKNSGKFNNQMSRVQKNKDKYDIIDKAKKFDKDLKKTNKERYDIDKSHEKDKWEEQEKYKARHNTKEAQRYEKNEYKKMQDFKAKKQSNNKTENERKWEVKSTAGFGQEYGEGNIPIRDGQVDYESHFGSLGQDLTLLSDKELQTALDTQQKMYDKYSGQPKTYDARTRNGRMERIFRQSELTDAKLSVEALKKEKIRRENEKHPQYKGTDYEVKYASVKDAINDPNSKINQYIAEKKAKKTEAPKEIKSSNVVKDVNGVSIDQNWAKEQYSGMSYEDIKRNNDWEKENRLENINPEYKPMWEARIRETDKYLENMPKYESRIGDDFGTKEWDSGYPLAQNAWKGTKSNSGLYGKDKIKAIDDDVKKAYPEVKTSRTTGRGGYTDSFSYSVLESDTPVIRSIEDFSDTELNRLYNKGYNSNYYKSVGEYKDALAKELQSGYLDVNQYNIDDDARLTPYGKQLFKDIVKVSNAYNFDESDAMTDYFHTGHYLNLHVGKSGKPFKLNESKKIKDYVSKKKSNHK